MNGLIIRILPTGRIFELTLIFSGHDYKYELESVVKLFIPAKHFSFVYSDEKPRLYGDFCFLRRHVGEKNILIYAVCQINGKRCQRLKKLPAACNNDIELELSKLLYLALSELCNIRPEWGVITGVRPVKRVNDMIGSGKTDEQIKKSLSEVFYVTESKANLALATAKNQRELLSNLPKNAFSLYVGIPFCPTRCAYCSFVSQKATPDEKIVDEYLSNLLSEIRYTAAITKRLGLFADTVYIGGGTPTTLNAEQLDELLSTINYSFDVSRLREFTVEAGRPDTVAEEKLNVIKRAGAGRISVNPQTLNESVLEAIGRRHTAADFYSAFELARKVGFEAINCDIIAGLPTDTAESFKATIDGLIRLSPENITVHTLSVKRASNLNLSGEREVFKNPAGQMLKLADEALFENGYSPYYLYRQKNMVENLENVGWEKGGTPSLYNVYIMEEVQSIIALGAGASTKLVDTKRGSLERIFNYKHALEYNKHFDLMLKKKDEIEAFYNA